MIVFLGSVHRHPQRFIDSPMCVCACVTRTWHSQSAHRRGRRGASLDQSRTSCLNTAVSARVLGYESSPKVPPRGTQRASNMLQDVPKRLKHFLSERLHALSASSCTTIWCQWIRFARAFCRKSFNGHHSMISWHSRKCVRVGEVTAVPFCLMLLMVSGCI